MQTISTLVICLDERKNMVRMLSWLIDYVHPDETIIVDGGSKDGTLEVIDTFRESANIKLIKHPMPDSFAEQRNLALNNCGCDWVLHIDADETYSKSISKLISSVVAGKHDDILGFTFPTAHLIIDEFHMIDGGGDIHLRLFKNLPGISYVGEVHEQLCYDSLPILTNRDKFDIEPAVDIALKHFSMLGGNDELLKKGRRWTRWIERSIRAGIPITGESHFVDAVKNYKGSPLEVPKEWY